MKQTLYKKDQSGSIRVWQIEVTADTYNTSHGIHGGKIVKSGSITAKGKNIGKKNETTPHQQAILEAQALCKKQKKLGYFDTVKQAQNDETYLKPMLAKKWNDYKHKIDLSSGEYILQCKFNGLRCVATKDGLFSRKGERFLCCPHIESDLKPFFDKYPEAVLDGEIFNEDLRQELNALIHIVRKTVRITEAEYAEAKAKAFFYIYDGYGFAGLDESTNYEFRKSFIDSKVSAKSVRRVKDYKVLSEDDLNGFFGKMIEDNHEGIMIRALHSDYVHGRSSNLLKHKPKDDDEFIVVDIEEGSGDWAGKAKRITLKDKNGKVFGAAVKGEMSTAVKILLNKDKIIGKEVTVEYFGFTGLGTPNFAQFDINNQKEIFFK